MMRERRRSAAGAVDGGRVTLFITDETTARLLLDCDVIVGCTDNQWSRMVLNALAYQFYVPLLDLGVELQTSGAMGGRVTWLAPGSACLWCLNVLDAQRIRAEQLPAATLQDEVARGYVQGLDELAPAVVSINGVVASLAVTELLARTTGFAGPNPRAHERTTSHRIFSTGCARSPNTENRQAGQAVTSDRQRGPGQPVKIV